MDLWKILKSFREAMGWRDRHQPGFLHRFLVAMHAALETACAQHVRHLHAAREGDRPPPGPLREAVFQVLGRAEFIARKLVRRGRRRP